jgi:dimethylaniline monooxygenase (N-oxide forming)
MSILASIVGDNKNNNIARSVKSLTPTTSLQLELRSSLYVQLQLYHKMIRRGSLEVINSEIESFSSGGILLKNGKSIDCDTVILALGCGNPCFDILPNGYRKLMTSDTTGTQLYRHIIHPRIPNVGFVGFNHSFLHIPCAELGALWTLLWMEGIMKLPSVAEMEATMSRVDSWKSENIVYSPSQNYAVGPRFQQYLDTLCKDMNVSTYRKMPNVIAEVFMRYGPADYRGLSEEVDKIIEKRNENNRKFTPKSIDM